MFNPMQIKVIEDRLGVNLSDDDDLVNHGLYAEEGTIQDIPSGDKLSIIGSEITVTKHSEDFNVPVIRNGQHYKMQSRNYYKFPATHLAEALTVFIGDFTHFG